MATKIGQTGRGDSLSARNEGVGISAQPRTNKMTDHNKTNLFRPAQVNHGFLDFFLRERVIVLW